MEERMLRTICSFLFVLFFAGNSFAGEVISKEAVNYYQEGLKLQKASNFAMADSFYQKTLLVDPYNSKWQKFILNNRGAMKAQQGSMDEAEILFKRSLQVDPAYLPAQLNLGFIYEQRRSELESIKYWLSVLNINLDDVKPKGFVLGEVQDSEVIK
jgi:tetratricopeptide (TPR) repeat protein